MINAGDDMALTAARRPPRRIEMKSPRIIGDA
jgi:hypothetical protein